MMPSLVDVKANGHTKSLLYEEVARLTGDKTKVKAFIDGLRKHLAQPSCMLEVKDLGWWLRYSPSSDDMDVDEPDQWMSIESFSSGYVDGVERGYGVRFMHGADLSIYSDLPSLVETIMSPGGMEQERKAARQWLQELEDA